MKLYFYILGIALSSTLEGITLQQLAPIQVQSNGWVNSVDLSRSNLTDIAGIDMFQVIYKEQRIPLSKVPNLRLSFVGNQLTYLPPEIGNLTNLSLLSLSSNQLMELPAEIGNLTNLSQLYLRYNQLTKLPPEIGKLTNLSQLYLRDNQLAELPMQIGNLINLTIFSLSENQLIKLPPEIGNLTKLIKLYLKNNQLAVLPAGLGNLNNLKELYLKNNHLTELPAEIKNLINLEKLDLKNNQLIKLSAEISNLVNLEKIDLSDNQLTELPEEFSLLKSLTWLNFLDNPSSYEMRGSISNMRTNKQLIHLITLNGSNFLYPLYANPLSKWIPEMAPIVHKKINGLIYNHLDLSNRSLKSINGIDALMVYGVSEGVVQPITDIEDLYINLANNDITELPSGIKKLQLKGIKLDHNINLQDIRTLESHKVYALFLRGCTSIPKDQINAILGNNSNTLQTLDLKSIYFTSEELNKLAHAINDCQLQNIKLDQNLYATSVEITDQHISMQALMRQLIKRAKPLHTFA